MDLTTLLRLIPWTCVYAFWTVLDMIDLGMLLDLVLECGKKGWNIYKTILLVLEMVEVVLIMIINW